MSSDILVEASGLGKSYPKVFHRRDRFNALLRLLSGRAGIASTAVLSEIDLCVRRGQSLGLIGENGAGKSTLLKLLTGVLTPSQGTVAVHGKVGALLELGAGFHPDYTGRDNIALAGALYGFSDQELRQKLPEIIEFADIGEYIDEPVKHYSSGMVVRLGFAVVAAARPDLLITDEILAVGDESFQKKCVQWMTDYLDSGGTLILVSHSMYHIQKLCRQACWLQHGKIAAQGDVFDVTQAYLAYHERESTSTSQSRQTVVAQGLEFYLLDMALNGETHERPLLLEQGASLQVSVRVQSRHNRVPIIFMGIVRADGTAVYGVSTEMDQVTPTLESPGIFRIDLMFAHLPLLPGSYCVRAHPLDPEGVRLFDTLERVLTIRGASREFGMVRLAHEWNANHSGITRQALNHPSALSNTP